MGIIESANRDQEQMCVLTTIKVKANGGRRQRGGRSKRPDKGKKEEEEEELVLAMPVNSKLPWGQLESIPDEYYKDLKEGKKINCRYYIGKYKEWTDF